MDSEDSWCQAHHPAVGDNEASVVAFQTPPFFPSLCQSSASVHEGFLGTNASILLPSVQICNETNRWDCVVRRGWLHAGREWIFGGGQDQGDRKVPKWNDLAYVADPL